MNSEKTTSNRHQILYLAIIPVICTWAIVPISFLIPVVDSTRAPYFDLNGNFAELFYWIAESAGRYGAPLIALSLTGLILYRKSPSSNSKLKELTVFLSVGALFAAGGALFNEHIIKSRLKIPRPNIIFLAGENGNGPLGITAEEFYDIGKKKKRRKPLSTVLDNNPESVALSDNIKKHWIAETGYSFPSGHSYSCFFTAAFFLLLAVTYIPKRRFMLFYLLLPWALAVCYSRPILRVHTPLDITVGSFLGIAAAVTAWLVVNIILKEERAINQ